MQYLEIFDPLWQSSPLYLASSAILIIMAWPLRSSGQLSIKPPGWVLVLYQTEFCGMFSNFWLGCGGPSQLTPLERWMPAPLVCVLIGISAITRAISPLHPIVLRLVTAGCLASPQPSQCQYLNKSPTLSHWTLHCTFAQFSNTWPWPGYSDISIQHPLPYTPFFIASRALTI